VSKVFRVDVDVCDDVCRGGGGSGEGEAGGKFVDSALRRFKFPRLSESKTCALTLGRFRPCTVGVYTAHFDIFHRMVVPTAMKHNIDACWPR